METGIRTLALELLDDEQGINKPAFRTLSDLLLESGNEDIVDAVSENDNRVYISSNAAECLRDISIQ